MIDAAKSIPQLTQEFKDKFLSLIHINNSTGCHEWTGWRDAEGYGSICINRERFRAHRIAFSLSSEDDIRGMCILHKCDNPGCVNFEHLVLGTHKDNMADKKSKGRQSGGDTHYARTSPEKLARGASAGGAKLKDDDVKKIRVLRNDNGLTLREIGAMFGVSLSTIHLIASRKTWDHIA